MDRSRNRRSISAIAAAITAVILIASPASLAQQMSPIVLFTSKEQIPLKAYAEMMRAGILQIVSGSAKDIPTVSDVSYFRCALTGWAPNGARRAASARKPPDSSYCRSSERARPTSNGPS